MLIHVIYISKATKVMDDEELRQLLVTARNNNKKEKITGQLIYKDQRFIQLLEGEESIIDKMYERISNDSRHSHIEKISRMPLEKRSYADWSMGFKNLNGSNDNMLDGFDPNKLTDSNLVFRLLNHFTH